MGWRTEFAPAKRVAWAANEAYLTVRRDIALRPEGDYGGAVEVAKRPVWAGLSDFKKTLKIAGYFAPQQITGEKVGLDEGDVRHASFVHASKRLDFTE